MQSAKYQVSCNDKLTPSLNPNGKAMAKLEATHWHTKHRHPAVWTKREASNIQVFMTPLFARPSAGFQVFKGLSKSWRSKNDKSGLFHGIPKSLLWESLLKRTSKRPRPAARFQQRKCCDQHLQRHLPLVNFQLEAPQHWESWPAHFTLAVSGPFKNSPWGCNTRLTWAARCGKLFRLVFRPWNLAQCPILWFWIQICMSLLQFFRKNEESETYRSIHVNLLQHENKQTQSSVKVSHTSARGRLRVWMTGWGDSSIQLPLTEVLDSTSSVQRISNFKATNHNFDKKDELFEAVLSHNGGCSGQIHVPPQWEQHSKRVISKNWTKITGLGRPKSSALALSGGSCGKM